MADQEPRRDLMYDFTGWLFIVASVLILAIGLSWLLGDGDRVLAWMAIVTAAIIIPVALAELKPFAEWRRARRHRKENRVLAALADGPLSSYEIGQRSGLSAGTLFPLLERWARVGFVESEWGEPMGPEPEARRRSNIHTKTSEPADDSTSGRSVFDGIATATLIKPGDRVLLTTARDMPLQDFNRLSEMLTQGFPGVWFSIVVADSAVIIPAEAVSDAG